MYRSNKKDAQDSRDVSAPEPNDGLPDSHQPSGLCPRCGHKSSFEVVGSLPISFNYELYAVLPSGVKEPEVAQRASSLVCRHCKQGVAVVEDRYVGETRSSDARTGGTISYRGFHWWPTPETRAPRDVPSEIGDAYAEAVAALTAGCPRASAVMARRTLEAIAADQGETSGRLADRLAALAKRGTLQPTLADWAKEVRLLGNTGAHFDPIDTVSNDDAQQLLSFLQELMKYLYELPAELDRRRSST